MSSEPREGAGVSLRLRGATAACALAILVSSLIPRGAAISILPSGEWDKPWHLGGFGLQALLLALCLRQSGVVRSTSVGLTLVAVCGYGVLAEGLQAFVPGRIASWQDLLADGLGAALGTALVAALRWPPDGS